ncbi:hypothetical protein [Microseira wollei]|uniref:Uncharacterized protein n=1 Tax=Microseira wollei NIES-4236 TaxID=2530354 RepID=A0AAV3XLJ9_9CYAN|nr:hypothetical protein [Microseira wollei]GET42421.1 hypothetical protein MiSe_72380 [Microseira wollei NIES-4236]
MNSELEDILSNRENGDLLSKSSANVMKLALEYAKLAALPNPSEQEADRLGEILALASDCEILSFWIVEVDRVLGHHLDLLDEDDRESYKDQQALIRDYAGTKNFLTPADEQIKEYISSRKPELYNPDDEPIPR